MNFERGGGAKKDFFDVSPTDHLASVSMDGRVPISSFTHSNSLFCSISTLTVYVKKQL